MAGIDIRRVGDLYVVAASPARQTQSASASSVLPYLSGGPVSRREAIDALLARGWHQQDIGDAFYEADPDWLER